MAPLRLIGPRRANGTFYKKRPAVRKPRTTTMPKQASVKLIKKILKSQIETKYCASSGTYAPKGSIVPSSMNILMLPPVYQQTTVGSTNVREGDYITPTRFNMSGFVRYNNAFGLTNFPANSVYVKLFFVTPKDIKDSFLTPNLLPEFIENGTADPVNWTSGVYSSLNSFLPVCKQLYTVLKTKTIKLVKNQGTPINNPASPTTTDTPNVAINGDCVPWSISLKVPRLKYVLDASFQPTNYCPLMFAVAYIPGIDFDFQGLGGSLAVDYQSQLWFKDA